MQQSLLQSDIWGSFRETLGWHAHKAGDILVLERALPMGKTFLYSPEVSGEPHLLLDLLPKVYDIARRRNSIFYRLELLVDKHDDLAEEWEAAFRYTGFSKAFESVQPDDRQIVSLEGGESRILAHMKPKGRYNIRVAEKAGVRVRESTPKTLEADTQIFYALFQQTAKRDKFSIRPYNYFLQLVHMIYEHNCGRLFVAKVEDQPVAATIATNYNGIASYLYGASGNTHRQAMAPYALHWAIMQWAESNGATSYDLLAIKPEGVEKHSYEGITRFKQQFGGEAVHLLGSWDVRFEPTWYSLFALVEKIRR